MLRKSDQNKKGDVSLKQRRKREKIKKNQKEV
jgi:hypothetical protein